MPYNISCHTKNQSPTHDSKQLCVFFLSPPPNPIPNLSLQTPLRNIMYTNSRLILQFIEPWNYSFAQNKCVQLIPLKLLLSIVRKKYSSCFTENNDSSPCPTRPPNSANRTQNTPSFPYPSISILTSLSNHIHFCQADHILHSALPIITLHFSYLSNTWPWNRIVNMDEGFPSAYDRYFATE